MDLIFNQETHRYEIDKFDEVSKNVELFIQENAGNTVLPIIDEPTLKQARAKRTIINNKLKEIQKFRKQTNAVVVGDFNKMSLSIEKMLSEESDRITDMMEAYQPKPTVYVFKEIKTTDKDAYDQLVAFAKQLNLIKEEQE